jgi:hypothetical protein
VGFESVEDLDRELMKALYEKRLPEAVESLGERKLTDEQRDRVGEIRHSVAEIDRRVRSELAVLVASFGSLDVDATIRETSSIDGSGTISIPEQGFDVAAGLLLEAGFVPMHRLSPGAARARRRFRRRVSLVACDSSLTAVTLAWGDPRPIGALGRLFVPALPDLRAIPLPESLWWGYWLIRPARLAYRTVRRRSDDRPAGPFLGTPLGLVTPLLEPFDLGPESMIVDVGSGDGRVLIRATQVFGCRGRGIELDGELVELSRAHVAKAGLADRITIEESDLRDSSVDDADLVFAFLPGSAASSVIPEIQPRLALGASLVAHEQERIDWVVPPDSSRLVVSDSGITVAHVWAG